MKKNSFFLLALTGLSLASCSSDEVTDVNPGNAIEFQTVVGKSTRAEYTTNGANALSEFKVWAFATDGTAPFMDGLKVSKTEGKWGYGATQYWPKAQVNFYAVAPYSVVATINKEAQTITDYVVKTDAKEDLIYAKTSMTGDKTNSTVKLNFKHALSKIVFTAKLADNATISVTVKSIKVSYVDNKGTFTLSSDAWSSVGASTNRAANTYTASSTTTDLSTSTLSTENDALFLMPQTLVPWNTSTATTPGAKIIVDCVVKDKNSGAVLHTGNVYVPLKVTDASNVWAAGTKYVYNLVFGQGAGFDENGKPVLVPVTLDVEVSEFATGTTTDPSMN